jgi:predicted Zn-dependent peptidase
MNHEFYRKILKNGMTLIFEKRKIPVVSVGFAVRNGGVNEHISEKGISHFIEHMLYKGTPSRNAKRIAEEIEKNGGELNGFTDECITAFWCKMPSKHLNIALDVLSDMIKNPLFDEKELEKERKVIFEEIKMRKDSPITFVFDEIQGNLYGGTLGKPLIGSHETMNSISRNKMLKKFREIYKPNNMILCVVGDAELSEVMRFVEKTFEHGRGRVPKLKVSKKNESKIVKRKGIDQANLVFAYHVPLAHDKKCYAAQVLSTLMAEGMSSRLFGEIREKRNLAYAVKGDANINKTFSYNIIYVGTTKENIPEIRKIILNEFKKVAQTLDEKELNEVKEQIIGNYQISMEDSQSQMVNLLSFEIAGNAQEFYEFEKNIREVKLKDVREIARKAIEKFSFLALVPE